MTGTSGLRSSNLCLSISPMNGTFGDLRFQEDADVLASIAMSELQPRASFGVMTLSLELIPDTGTGREAVFSIDDSSATHSDPPLGGVCPTELCSDLKDSCSVIIEFMIEDTGIVFPSSESTGSPVSIC